MVFSSVQFSSVAQSCPTLCDPMNRSMPGLPVHHHLLEFTQTHVHRVRDAIQPSHPRSSPSPPALNPSQHHFFPVSQLFSWGGQSTGVSALASFLPKKPQGWSPSEWTGWISLQSKGLSRVFSNTTVQKHQFFSAQPDGLTPLVLPPNTWIMICISPRISLGGKWNVQDHLINLLFIIMCYLECFFLYIKKTSTILLATYSNSALQIKLQ